MPDILCMCVRVFVRACAIFISVLQRARALLEKQTVRSSLLDVGLYFTADEIMKVYVAP